MTHRAPRSTIFERLDPHEDHPDVACDASWTSEPFATVDPHEDIVAIVARTGSHSLLIFLASIFDKDDSALVYLQSFLDKKDAQLAIAKNLHDPWQSFLLRDKR